MKVLLAHMNFYHKGGDSVEFFSTAKLLEENGHSVVFFSMDSPENEESRFSKYFLSHVDFNVKKGVFQKLRTAGRILYSFEARRKILKLIDDEKPDIVHLHSIYHSISPSIISAIKKKGLPIVMTLHNYKVVCPAYLLQLDGKPCELCKNGAYYNCLLKKCVKGSYLKSMLSMVEMYLHHRLLKLYAGVDIFIAPSRFLVEKVRELGFSGKFTYLPHLDQFYRKSFEDDECEESISYFGRLSKEKGLLTLFDAVRDIDIKLKVIGDGPQREELERKIKDEGIKNVELLGFMSGEKLFDELGRSKFTVMPSQWYEVNPLTILESFAIGKPVIASDVGSMPEILGDTERGLLFKVGDAIDLKKKIETLLSDDTKVIEMGRIKTHLMTPSKK